MKDAKRQSTMNGEKNSDSDAETMVLGKQERQWNNEQSVTQQPKQQQQQRPTSNDNNSSYLNLGKMCLNMYGWLKNQDLFELITNIFTIFFFFYKFFDKTGTDCTVY